MRGNAATDQADRVLRYVAEGARLRVTTGTLASSPASSQADSANDENVRGNGLTVDRHISPNDQMFDGNSEHYFGVGLSALRCIQLAMTAADLPTVTNVLDLPCGHGRVLRALRAAFPEAQLTACDILADGVDFCASEFGAVPVYACQQIGQSPITGKFDLIWCGSLLTHLRADYWHDFLTLFSSRLLPGGIVCFTTQGRLSARWLRTRHYDYCLAADASAGLLDEYDRDGYGYRDYPGQNSYGVSISSPGWVLRELEKHPELRVVVYSEHAWDNHQDVFACQLSTGAQVS
jgi:SAM-dependent methyltransferase